MISFFVDAYECNEISSPNNNSITEDEDLTAQDPIAQDLEHDFLNEYACIIPIEPQLPTKAPPEKICTRRLNAPKEVTQGDVLVEQFNALKQNQENLKLKN